MNLNPLLDSLRTARAALQAEIDTLADQAAALDRAIAALDSTADVVVVDVDHRLALCASVGQQHRDPGRGICRRNRPPGADAVGHAGLPFAGHGYLLLACEGRPSDVPRTKTRSAPRLLHHLGGLDLVADLEGVSKAKLDKVVGVIAMLYGQASRKAA